MNNTCRAGVIKAESQEAAGDERFEAPSLFLSPLSQLSFSLCVQVWLSVPLLHAVCSPAHLSLAHKGSLIHQVFTCSEMTVSVDWHYLNINL